MELRPADLGDAFATSVVVRRAAGRFDRFVVFLFRLFLRNYAGLPRKQANEALQQISASTSFFTSLPFFIGVLIGLAFVVVTQILPYQSYIQQSGSYGFLVQRVIAGVVQTLAIQSLLLLAIRGTALRKLFVAPVTYQEAYDFFQAQTDPVLRSYGHLLCDAIGVRNIIPSAVPAIRDAIRLLGEAGHRLSTVHTVPGDVRSLRSKAIFAQGRASTEDDPIAKAALLQEAGGYEQAMSAAEQNALIIKRVTALKGALAAQIEALRLEIPVLQTNTPDTSHLIFLSETVRAVASQAEAVTSAHAELDSSLNADTVSMVSPAPAMQKVSVGHNGGS